jgi:long-chain acyl-CoA synthetase
VNISQNVERAATFFPEKPAIVFEGTQITYGDLNTRVNRLANGLKANKVGRGACVAVYLPNIPEFTICYLAAVRVGAIAVSINSMYKSEELKYIINDSACVLIFTTGDLLPNIPLNECPSLKQVLVCEGDPQNNPTLEAWLQMIQQHCFTLLAPLDSRKARHSPTAMSSRTHGRQCIMPVSPLKIE